MSFIIYKSELDEDHKKFIKDKCNIYKKQKYLKSEKFECLTIFKVNELDNEETEILLPLSLWKTFLDEFPNTNHDIINANFNGTPLEIDQRDQQTVLNESYKKLQLNHYLFLGLRTGFGKTFCSLYLICQLGLKAVIICHNTKLHEQWVDEGKKYCPNLKMQIVKKKLDDDADVYIMGVIKATHYDKKILRRIGTLIVDETHLTYTNTFTDSLLQFTPKYLIGLSATPDRPDGLHNLLYPFFGPKKEFIIRTQVKEFKVIKYETNYKPMIRFRSSGRLDWDGIIKSISFRYDRQQLILQLINSFFDGELNGSKEENKNKKILILCLRVCTILGCKNYSNCKCLEKASYGLVNILKENYFIDYVAENKSKFNNDCQILIGTYKKLSVGFDSDRDMLILETDITDVRQSEGRIRKNNNLIIDIVDNFSTLEKHWYKRESWYRDRGATIEVIKRD